MAKTKELLFDPVVNNNPIALQVLGMFCACGDIEYVGGVCDVTGCDCSDCLFKLICLGDPFTDSKLDPNHCTNDDHRVVGDCGGSNSQSLCL